LGGEFLHRDLDPNQLPGNADRGSAPVSLLANTAFFDAEEGGFILESLRNDALCLFVDTIFKIALRPFFIGDPIRRNTLLTLRAPFCEVYSA
jgi:hypothetical protein